MSEGLVINGFDESDDEKINIPVIAPIEKILTYRECVCFGSCWICCFCCVLSVLFVILLGLGFIHVTEFEKKDIDFWNRAVDNFRDYYEEDFHSKNTSFKYIINYNNSNKISLERKISSDPTPLDRTKNLPKDEIDIYEALKYEADNVVLIPKNTPFKDSSYTELTILNLNSDIATQRIKVLLMEETSFSPHKKNEDDDKKECNSYKEAYWDARTKSCHQKFVIKSICISVDPEIHKKSAIKTNMKNSNCGCFKGDASRTIPNDDDFIHHQRPEGTECYIVGSYELIPFSTKIIDEDIYGSIKIRHYADPFLLFFDYSLGLMLIQSSENYIFFYPSIIVGSFDVILFCCPAFYCTVIICYVCFAFCFPKIVRCLYILRKNFPYRRGPVDPLEIMKRKKRKKKKKVHKHNSGFIPGDHEEDIVDVFGEREDTSDSYSSDNGGSQYIEATPNIGISINVDEEEKNIGFGYKEI